MKVKDYLYKFNENQFVTFVKARARKDANTPYYHAEYQTTPMRTIREWGWSNIMDYYILNDKQNPIDWLSGASWSNMVKRGDLLSLLVISKEDLETLYSPKQAEDIIKSIDKKLNERGTER